MIKIDAKGGVVRGKPGEANGLCNLSWGVGTLCQDAESRFCIRFVSERR